MLMRLARAVAPYGAVEYLRSRRSRRQSQVAVEYRKRNLPLMAEIKARFPDIPVIEEIVDRSDPAAHGLDEVHIQFWFASNRLSKIRPRAIHDVGSHRSWILGVGAALPVNSLDVRPSQLVLDLETSTTGRAEELPYPSDSVDCITSLCSLEHFGLGSYGDAFDPSGDTRAVSEVKRVLKPGGHYIFTTTLTRSQPFVVFNTRRVYTADFLRRILSEGFVCEEEKFFSRQKRQLIPLSEVVDGVAPYVFDLCLGDWRRV